MVLINNDNNAFIDIILSNPSDGQVGDSCLPSTGNFTGICSPFQRNERALDGVGGWVTSITFFFGGKCSALAAGISGFID